MFTVVNELFATPENRPEFERNFLASMRGTLRRRRLITGKPELSSPSCTVAGFRLLI